MWLGTMLDFEVSLVLVQGWGFSAGRVGAQGGSPWGCRGKRVSPGVVPVRLWEAVGSRNMAVPAAG